MTSILGSQRGERDGRPYKKEKQNSSGHMNENICQTVSSYTQSVEIIIERKTHIRYGPIYGMALEGCIKQSFKCEGFQPEVGIVSNIENTIVNERALKGV